MAVTLPEVFDALVAQLVASGLTEAASPVGATNQPSTVIDHSFSVSFDGEQDTGETRSRTDRGAMHIAANVTVTIINKNPPRGQQALRAALVDTQTAIRAAWASATDLTAAVRVDMRGRIVRALAGGGGYYTTTIPLTLTFALDLSTEAVP